jgi:hypothetical protein
MVRVKDRVTAKIIRQMCGDGVNKNQKKNICR